MSWWIVGLVALLPWLRIAVQPSITSKAAGLWAISVTGVGMVGVILAGGAARLTVAGDVALDGDAVMAALVCSATVAVSGLVMFGVAATNVQRQAAPHSM